VGGKKSLWRHPFPVGAFTSPFYIKSRKKKAGREKDQNFCAARAPESLCKREIN
jgi:hypothetical protein